MNRWRMKMRLSLRYQPPSVSLSECFHPYVTSQEQEIIVFFTFWKVQVFYKNYIDYIDNIFNELNINVIIYYINTFQV